MGIKKEWRIKYYRELNKKIEPFAPDLCVLAGYMLIVSTELCQKYDIFNLHPAPPRGATGSWQYVRGSRQTGLIQTTHENLAIFVGTF